jgi:hypothetical protein
MLAALTPYARVDTRLLITDTLASSSVLRKIPASSSRFSRTASSPLYAFGESLTLSSA